MESMSEVVGSKEHAAKLAIVPCHCTKGAHGFVYEKDGTRAFYLARGTKSLDPSTVDLAVAFWCGETVGMRVRRDGRRVVLDVVPPEEDPAHPASLIGRPLSRREARRRIRAVIPLVERIVAHDARLRSRLAPRTEVLP